MTDHTSPTLAHMAQGLELFLQYDPTMHINTALVFITVAISPGIRKTYIEPLDSRSLRVHLTKKGGALRDRIISTLERIPNHAR